MPAQVIKISGARQHNLKNLHLEIPAGRFLVLVVNHDMMHQARHWKPAGIGNTLHLDEAGHGGRTYLREV